jgi:RNA polymerase sigma-70 factor (ECF subfamily)
LLIAYSDGDEQAFEKLFPLVYDELRAMADKYMRREHVGHTLQPTALVHEAYLRLVNQDTPWQNRSHFFGVAAQIMRRILVDYARRNIASKRGGGNRKVSLDEVGEVAAAQPESLLALDEALERLARMDEEKCRIVELRYFAGLSVEETADAMKMSVATVMRHWSMARAWLHKQVGGQM